MQFRVTLKASRFHPHAMLFGGKKETASATLHMLQIMLGPAEHLLCPVVCNPRDVTASLSRIVPSEETLVSGLHFTDTPCSL